MASAGDSTAPPAIVEHLDPVIASSNRCADVEPYCTSIYYAEPEKWGHIMPWEFPQGAPREVEESFLREWFEEREIHIQGGTTGAGGGFRFLKQVWYTIARFNEMNRVPAIAQSWWENNIDIVKDHDMHKWLLHEDAEPKTFWQRPELELFGEKLLWHIIPHIHYSLRQYMDTLNHPEAVQPEPDRLQVPKRAQEGRASPQQSPTVPASNEKANDNMPVLTTASNASIKQPECQSTQPNPAARSDPLTNTAAHSNVRFKNERQVMHNIQSMQPAWPYHGQNYMPGPQMPFIPPQHGPQMMFQPGPYQNTTGSHRQHGGDSFEHRGRGGFRGRGRGRRHTEHPRQHAANAQSAPDSFQFAHPGGMHPPAIEHMGYGYGSYVMPDPALMPGLPPVPDSYLMAGPPPDASGFMHPGVQQPTERKKVVLNDRTNQPVDHALASFEMIGVTPHFIGAAREDVMSLAVFTDPPSIDQAKIKGLFAALQLHDYKVKVVKQDSKWSPVSFVSFKNTEDTRRALTLNGTTYQGFQIRLEVSRHYWQPGASPFPPTWDQPDTAILSRQVSQQNGNVLTERADGSWQPITQHGAAMPEHGDQPTVVPRDAEPDIQQMLQDRPPASRATGTAVADESAVAGSMPQPKAKKKKAKGKHTYSATYDRDSNDRSLAEPGQQRTISGAVRADPTIGNQAQQSQGRRERYSSSGHSQQALHEQPGSTSELKSTAPINKKSVGSSRPPRSSGSDITNPYEDEPATTPAKQDTLPAAASSDGDRTRAHAVTSETPKTVIECVSKPEDSTMSQAVASSDKMGDVTSGRQAGLSTVAAHAKSDAVKSASNGTALPIVATRAKREVVKDVAAAGETVTQTDAHIATKSTQGAEQDDLHAEATKQSNTATIDQPTDQPAEESSFSAATGQAQAAESHVEAKTTDAPADPATSLPAPGVPESKMKQSAVLPPKQEKVKGPSQTESFSMFGRKAEKGKKKDTKSKGSIKGKSSDKAPANRVVSAPAGAELRHNDTTDTKMDASNAAVKGNGKQRSQTMSTPTTDSEVKSPAEADDKPKGGLSNLFGLLGTRSTSRPSSTSRSLSRQERGQTILSTSRSLSRQESGRLTPDSLPDDANSTKIPDAASRANERTCVTTASTSLRASPRTIYEEDADLSDAAMQRSESDRPCDTPSSTDASQDIGEPSLDHNAPIQSAYTTITSSPLNPSIDSSHSNREQSRDGVTNPWTGEIFTFGSSLDSHQTLIQIDNSDRIDSSNTLSACSQDSSDHKLSSPARRLAEMLPRGEKPHLVGAPKPRNAHKRRPAPTHPAPPHSPTKPEDEAEVAPGVTQSRWDEIVKTFQDAREAAIKDPFKPDPQITEAIRQGSLQHGNGPASQNTDNDGVMFLLMAKKDNQKASDSSSEDADSQEQEHTLDEASRRFTMRMIVPESSPEPAEDDGKPARSVQELDNDATEE